MKLHILNWTKINSPVEVVYKVPVRAVYFLFSPFPWDIKKFSHIIGAIDGLAYLILVYFIFAIERLFGMIQL